VADIVSRLLGGALGLLTRVSKTATLPQTRASAELGARLGLHWRHWPELERGLQEAALAERRACVGHVEAEAIAATLAGRGDLGLELRALAYELQVGQAKGGGRG